jgi:cytochrome c-type biogenesis protein
MQMRSTLADPIVTMTELSNIPVLTALLLGLAATASPCQFTTNTSALAFVSKNASDRKETLTQLVAFVLGKLLVFAF